MRFLRNFFLGTPVLVDRPPNPGLAREALPDPHFIPPLLPQQPCLAQPESLVDRESGQKGKTAGGGGCFVGSLNLGTISFHAMRALGEIGVNNRNSRMDINGCRHDSLTPLLLKCKFGPLKLAFSILHVTANILNMQTWPR